MIGHTFEMLAFLSYGMICWKKLTTPQIYDLLTFFWEGVKVDQLYRMTTVDLKNLAYRDEPFFLANDVAQVFYVKDMSTKPRKNK